MHTPTLFLIQSDYAATDINLKKLQQMFSQGDQIVLMGDSVLMLDHPFLKQTGAVSILNNDAEILLDDLPAYVSSLSYPQFAALCLKHTRSISLK